MERWVAGQSPNLTVERAERCKRARADGTCVGCSERFATDGAKPVVRGKELRRESDADDAARQRPAVVAGTQGALCGCCGRRACESKHAHARDSNAATGSEK